jgi:hypothetical protein
VQLTIFPISAAKSLSIFFALRRLVGGIHITIAGGDFKDDDLARTT